MSERRMTVEICSGTTCFILGGADLLLLEDELDGLWKESRLQGQAISELIEIKASVCMEYCKEGSLKPPFVRVDGELHGHMRLEMLISLIEKRLFDQAGSLKESYGC